MGVQFIRFTVFHSDLIKVMRRIFAMTNRVTIRDVARYADVSMSTVSQILNGKASRFSNDTRQKYFMRVMLWATFLTSMREI